MNNYIFYYLKTNKSYLILKEFLQASFGFNLTLINLDGTFAEPLPVNAGLSTCGNSSDTSTDNTPNRFSNAHLLQEIKQTREATIIDLKRTGHKQIIIPVLRKDAVAGFICASKSTTSQIKSNEYETIRHFLADYISRLAANELEFIEHFHDKELTHQQCLIKGVLEYIHDNYHNPALTLKYVASQKGISYHYLSHLFKQAVNVSFNMYVNQIRFEKASRLLQNKSLPINQIARHCGFEDPAYFSKAFKKKTGLSPAEHRNKPHPSGKEKKEIVIRLNNSHLYPAPQKVLV